MIRSERPPQNERLYATTARRIAEMIQRDGLARGERLPSEQELSRMLQVSRATVREAIVALEVSGVVEVKLNVGAVVQAPYRAPDSALSVDMRNRLLSDAFGASNLREVTWLRIMIESDGAAMSIAEGGVGWESALVAAHHRLAHIESRMHRDGRADFDLWRQCDWEFHAALLSACGSELHQMVHKAAFEQFRRVVAHEFQTIGFRGHHIIEEHKAILDAALARDAEACARALETHISVYFRNAGVGGFQLAPKRGAATGA
jgi:DNA-binding FadR family transcriptional regulator